MADAHEHVHDRSCIKALGEGAVAIVCKWETMPGCRPTASRRATSPAVRLASSGPSDGRAPSGRGGWGQADGGLHSAESTGGPRDR